MSTLQEKEARDQNIAVLFRHGVSQPIIAAQLHLTRQRVSQILLRKFSLDSKSGGQHLLALRKKSEARKAFRKKTSVTLEQWKFLTLNGVTRKYRNQQSGAKARGIAFNLSLAQFWKIWCESGKFAERGRGADKYCMARFLDKGPYEIGNVKIITNRENSSEREKNKRLLQFKRRRSNVRSFKSLKVSANGEARRPARK
jgi:hypothetical protein